VLGAGIPDAPPGAHQVRSAGSDGSVGGFLVAAKGYDLVMSTGVLVLAGTPIGNSADASPRLLELLASADIVAAEDTRKLAALAQRLGVTVAGKVVACHEHNEFDVAPRLLDAVAAGQTVALVTDAGMPAVSDPGYRLVQLAADRNLPVTCVPGPSAVVTALALSGLPSDRFAFEGFLPRKATGRQRALAQLATESRTLVFFEAPHRILATIQDVASAFGDNRPAALCRELTKTYEEVIRGTLGELVSILQRREAEPGGIRGEFVIVVAPAAVRDEATPEDLVNQVIDLTEQGISLKDAAANIAAKSGVSKRELYNLALRAKPSNELG